ncbi:unannotated protein [freshwater metagenome]|uniref:Unannotated protein n=1 Tax=freshwater metagenome TaxID=449393 RepID=A0A6J6SB28_9ZZZZ
MQLPPEVRAYAGRGPAWAAWVERLPALVEELAEEWSLRADAPLTWGSCSVVLPGSCDGVPAVLKVAFPDEESEHEALALQRWGGRGAARLLRADPHRRALLAERLEARDLGELWDVEACEIVGDLYRSLHVAAPPQLRTLTAYVEPTLLALAGLDRSAPLPHRLVAQAVAVGRDLLGDAGAVGTLIHTDLHYDNVLASSRADEPGWLAIDPKPLSGDPHYEVAPLLWNRWDEIVASGSIRDGVRRRFHAAIDAALLDEDRARDWVVVRVLQNALWAIQEPDTDPSARKDWLTTCVSIAKAVHE